jgi:hypothetical protein
MKKKNNFATDIDDSLVPSIDDFAEFVSRKTKIRVTKYQLVGYSFENWPIPLEETYDLLHEFNNSEKHLAAMSVRPHAKIVFEKWQERYPHCVIDAVTNRDGEGVTGRVTREHLNLHLPLINEVYFCNFVDYLGCGRSRHKNEIIVGGGYDVFVEDKNSLIIEVAVANPNTKVFKMEEVWNKNMTDFPENVIPVKNWEEIGEKLKL